MVNLSSTLPGHDPQVLSDLPLNTFCFSRQPLQPGVSFFPAGFRNILEGASHSGSHCLGEVAGRASRVVVVSIGCPVQRTLRSVRWTCRTVSQCGRCSSWARLPVRGGDRVPLHTLEHRRRLRAVRVAGSDHGADLLSAANVPRPSWQTGWGRRPSRQPPQPDAVPAAWVRIVFVYGPRPVACPAETRAGFPPDIERFGTLSPHRRWFFHYFCPYSGLRQC